MEELCIAERAVHVLNVPNITAFPHVNAECILEHSVNIIGIALIDNPHRISCSTVVTVDVLHNKLSPYSECHEEVASLVGCVSAN